MYCNKCGEKLGDGINVCNACGFDVTNVVIDEVQIENSESEHEVESVTEKNEVVGTENIILQAKSTAKKERELLKNIKGFFDMDLIFGLKKEILIATTTTLVISLLAGGLLSLLLGDIVEEIPKELYEMGGKSNVGVGASDISSLFFLLPYSFKVGGEILGQSIFFGLSIKLKILTLCIIPILSLYFSMRKSFKNKNYSTKDLLPVYFVVSALIAFIHTVCTIIGKESIKVTNESFLGDIKVVASGKFSIFWGIFGIFTMMFLVQFVASIYNKKDFNLFECKAMKYIEKGFDAVGRLLVFGIIISIPLLVTILVLGQRFDFSIVYIILIYILMLLNFIVAFSSFGFLIPFEIGPASINAFGQFSITLPMYGETSSINIGILCVGVSALLYSIYTLVKVNAEDDIKELLINSGVIAALVSVLSMIARMTTKVDGLEDTSSNFFDTLYNIIALSDMNFGYNPVFVFASVFAFAFICGYGSKYIIKYIEKLEVLAKGKGKIITITYIVLLSIILVISTVKMDFTPNNNEKNMSYNSLDGFGISNESGAFEEGDTKIVSEDISRIIPSDNTSGFFLKHEDYNIYYYDIKKKQIQIIYENFYEKETLIISKDRKTIYFAADDIICKYNIQVEEVEEIVGLSNGINNMKISGDEKIIGVMYDNNVQMFNIDDVSTNSKISDIDRMESSEDSILAIDFQNGSNIVYEITSNMEINEKKEISEELTYYTLLGENYKLLHSEESIEYDFNGEIISIKDINVDNVLSFFNDKLYYVDKDFTGIYSIDVEGNQEIEIKNCKEIVVDDEDTIVYQTDDYRWYIYSLKTGEITAVSSEILYISGNNKKTEGEKNE